MFLPLKCPSTDIECCYIHRFLETFPHPPSPHPPPPLSLSLCDTCTLTWAHHKTLGRGSEKVSGVNRLTYWYIWFEIIPEFDSLKLEPEIYSIRFEMLSNDLLPLPNFNAGSDKSFKQWKYIWYWPFTLSDALCFALREGKPCSIDAAFQQTGFSVCQVQTRGKISKPAFLFCMLWCFSRAANLLKLLWSLLIARWFTGFEKLAIMVWQLVQFVLKQAGVDKRTGDLFGNRDLLNIARNMARGLKVG